MPNENRFAPVAVSGVHTYDCDAILAALSAEGERLGMTPSTFAGKRVVIKPNLVAAIRPDGAATTHPAFLCAVVAFLRAHGATDILLAESPGGLFSEATLRHNYKTCGILDAAESSGLPLNYDTSAETVHYSAGAACRAFHVLTPICHADVIVNLCKLKSHSLTRMSCAVKNFYGVIPGVEKFEMHSAYPTLPVFSEMIVDLCAMLCETHEVLAICDAITGMEGNGPTGGSPRDIGAVLMSRSPFSLDAVAETLIGFAGTVSITEAARRRGLAPAVGEAEVLGVLPAPLTDFVEPDTSKGSFLSKLPNLFGGRLANFLSPKPQIDLARCVGCGVCADSCPRHTITIETKKGKKRAVIAHGNCIRCFCCQELCPIHAVKIRKNPILKLVH